MNFSSESETPKLIPKFPKLSFSGSYFDLKLSNSGLLNFNDTTIKNAIEIVGHFDPENYNKETQNCIATLVITFSESLRFENIANFISRQMKSPQNKILNSKKLNYYIHHW